MTGTASGSGGWEWGESYPKDIRTKVNPISGTIPVQTSDNYRSASSNAGAGSSNSAQTQGQGQAANTDVAGVLKRNQACLQCRRRKLKCDAVRPHCSTCIRSHKHTLRTSPTSGAILTCDYDDGPATTNDCPSSSNGVQVGSSGGAVDAGATGKGGRAEHEHSPASGDEDPNGQARKKRKPTGQSAAGEGRRKKENEADKLRKKIEELEAQLANKSASPTVPESQTTTSNSTVDIQSQPWAFSRVGLNHPQPSRSASQSHMSASRNDAPISAQSPTAFLEMLSSAATAQPSRPSVSSGLKEGKNGTTMVTGGVFAAPTPLTDLGQSSSGTGLTPFFTYDPLNDSTLHAGQVTAQEDRPQIVSIDSDPSSVDLASANGRDTSYAFSGSSVNGSGASRQSSGVYNNSSIPPLTPSAIFNFPPTPAASGDVNAKAQATGMGYVPQFDADGSMKPSEKLDGPWRAVETVDTFLAGGGMPANGNMAGIGGMGMNNGNMQFSAQDAAEGMMSDLPPLDDAMQQQLLMDLFWPGWPANLPEPNIVNDLIEAFFELVPGLPRLLHRGRFLARMALPPTHSNFPHPALIHSICSIASNWCAPALYERSNLSRAFDPKTGKEWNFALRQAGLAKDQVHEGLNTGNRMFDVMILSRIFIDDTRMLECWAYNGLVARMILPLGLNVRSAGLSLKSVMLPPPADAIEREERRASMWFAVYHDTIASAASGWGTSVALDELSIPLPVSAKDFESGSESLEPNPQDLDSPDLYTRHPVPDPFVMVLKASVLLNRVNKFARKWKNRHVRDHDDYEGMARGEFRELANSIACFQMSFPPELRNPCKVGPKRKLDVDLIAAHLIPHAAIICLYEPFANLDDPGDQAAQRILNAAQAIVGTVQQMAALVQEGVQNFTTVMHSSTSICLVTSARTCLLFYRHALNQGNDVMAESLRGDVEMIRIALAQLGLKFKIGHHHAQLVEYFMDRATNPTYDKMSAHYPEHPRPGAPVLHPGADLGVCVMNALNVKRGYWRIANANASTSHGGNTGSNQGYAQQTDGISPFGTSSTPGSSGPSGSMSGGTSYTTMSTGSSNKGWANQLPSAGIYPDPPDACELLCQSTGNVAKANEEARIRSASQTVPNSASGSASQSPTNITGTAMTNEPAAQTMSASMVDYMYNPGQAGKGSGVDDGSSTIGWMLPYIGAVPGTVTSQTQSQQQQQAAKPDKWAIIDQLFTRPRADGTRDAFGLTAQERGAVGNASLGGRTGAVAEVQVQGGGGMSQSGGFASFETDSNNSGMGGGGGNGNNGLPPKLPKDIGGRARWDISEECKRAVG